MSRCQDGNLLPLKLLNLWLFAMFLAIIPSFHYSKHDSITLENMIVLL